MYYKKISFDPPEKEHYETTLEERKNESTLISESDRIEISVGQKASHYRYNKTAVSLVLFIAMVSLYFGAINKVKMEPDSPLCKIASYMLEGSISSSASNIDIENKYEFSAPSAHENAEPTKTVSTGISDTDQAQNDNPKVPGADLSASNLSKISNETEYTIDINELIEKKQAKSSPAISNSESEAVFGGFSPQVLIIHTHGTECYSDTDDTSYRSSNTDKNVVHVGKHLFDTLSKKGISAIHCSEMFDKDSYINAYRNSFLAVNEYLKKYPSIKYVVDLHRDAVQNDSGKYSKVLTSGGNAQLMFVVGTNEAGANHPEWKENLACAYELQTLVCEQHPDLMRPIYLRKASFNQQLLDGYFILEAGSCANTLDEVLPSVEAFGEVLAKKLKGE